MMYDKEFGHYKRTNFQHPKGLIILKPTAPRIQKVSRLNRMKQQLLYFTQGIHGVPYIWDRDFRVQVRLFWFSIVVVAITGCIAIYISLASCHSRQKIKTVVDTSQMPIYKINFPSVALCPWDHVNWLRYKAAEEKFLPPSADKNSKAVFYDVLRSLDGMSLSKLDSLALLKNRSIPPAIDEISISDLASFMAYRCEEFFVECIYDEIEYDCCKIFVPERTDKGICMVFNSMVSEESRKKQISDKFYPWKIRKAGEGHGLQFILRKNKTYQRDPRTKTKFAVDVMIKEDEEWSESLTNSFLRNRKSYISVTPIVSETSANIRHLKPQTRRCIFGDEKTKRYDRIEGLAFNKLNCIIKCQQKNFIRICNCTLSWLFPKIDIRECTVSDFKCIYKNRDTFSYLKSPSQDAYIKDSRRGVICDCVDNCNSLTFLTDLHANLSPDSNASFPLIYGDVYMGQAVVTKYETRLYSTTFDIIAQFGGILGLCLGASVLNLVEIVYAVLKIIVLFLVPKPSPKRKIKPLLKVNKN